MQLFEQAQALFAEPVTIETARQLEQLEQQAKGDEAKRVGSLWEAFVAAADPSTLEQAWQEGLI